MKHSLRRLHTAAFTLLELSIVVVIIALLVGGVAAGQNLVKASELRSVMTDSQNYLSAISAFRDQYRYLPGDLPTATSYGWTGNGNADGVISGDERFRLWQHLNNAGLIDKKLSGATGAGGTNDFVIVSSSSSVTPNIPGSRLAGTGFAVYYQNFAAGAGTTTGANRRLFVATLNNLMSFGASAGTDNGEPIWAALTPGDAYVIDTKMDDGKPGTGKWIANSTGPTGPSGTGWSDYRFGQTLTCTTAATSGSPVDGLDYSAAYKLTNAEVACSFFIATGF